MAGKHNRTLLSFKTADLNKGSYLVLAQIFLTLAKMGLA